MSPPAPGFTIFDTAIGRCGIAWGPGGILALQLPESSDRVTRNRMLRDLPEAREAEPPPEVVRAIDSIVALLDGRRDDLREIELDMSAAAAEYVGTYEQARAVAPGETITYGELAERVGPPATARTVGQAMAQNPFAIIVPCHRVVAANHKPGGFSADGGTETKLRMLAIETAYTRDPESLFSQLD